jgi:serine protease Do
LRFSAPFFQYLEYKMKKIGWQRLLAGAVLIVALMACGIFPQSVPLIQQVFPTQTPLTFNNFSTSTPLPNVTQSPLTTTLSTSKNPVTYLPIEQTFINVYEQVDPSVVHIRVVLKSSSTNPFPNFQLPNIPGLPFQNQPTPQAPDTAPDQAIGSGFIIDTNGHIVTNNHVIDGADRIIVTFADGSSAAGKVVGADPDSDLAVIQVNANPSLLKPVVFGDSDALKVGQMVVAIGNPFGLQNSMTTGIISGLGRLLPTDTQNTTGSSYSIPDIIQTDAPINPGNSGGPLLTLDGSIVGVNTAIESPVRSSSGVGYAVPVSIVKKVVPVLIQKGSYQHPWIGLRQ